MTTFIGIKLDNRVKNSTRFQETLTKFGCIIKTRLGLHDVLGEACSSSGIILLEVLDGNQKINFIEALKNIEEVKFSTMEI